MSEMTLKGAQSRMKVGSKGWPGRQVRGDRVAPWSVGEYAPAPGRRRPENRDNSQEIGILEPTRTSSLFGYSRSREMVSEGEHAFPRVVRLPGPPPTPPGSGETSQSGARGLGRPGSHTHPWSAGAPPAGTGPPSGSCARCPASPSRGHAGWSGKAAGCPSRSGHH